MLQCYSPWLLRWLSSCRLALRLLWSLALLLPLLPMLPKLAQAGELSIWLMPGTGQQAVQQLLAPYQAAHPDLRIKLTRLAADTAQAQVLAALVSGQVPDLLELDPGFSSSLAEMGALAEIDAQQVAGLGGAKAFFPALWATNQFERERKIYAIAWYAQVGCAFYRTDVFQAAGVNPGDAFANWGSFKRAMQKINGQRIDGQKNGQKNGQKIAALALPGKAGAGLWQSLAPWVWNGGADFLTSDNKKSAINSPAALHAIDYYASFAAEGLMPVAALAQDAAQIEVGFIQGQYALMFGGPAALKALTQAGVQNFALAPYPAGLKGQQTWLVGSNLALMRTGKNRKEAWELLAYLVSHEAQVDFYKIAGMLPTRIDAAHDPALLASPHYRQWLAQLKNGRNLPSGAAWAALEPIHVKNLAHLFASAKLDATHFQSVLDATAKEVNAVLGEVPP